MRTLIVVAVGLLLSSGFVFASSHLGKSRIAGALLFIALWLVFCAIENLGQKALSRTRRLCPRGTAQALANETPRVPANVALPSRDPGAPFPWLLCASTNRSAA